MPGVPVAHDEAHEPLTDTERQILAFLAPGPVSRPGVADSLGLKSRSGHLYKSISRLRELTVPDKPQSKGVASGQLGRPDIILASLPPLDSPEAALRLASMLDATFILDMMDRWPETFERLLPGPAFLRRLIAPLLLGNMAARRDKLVAEAAALSAATNTCAAGLAIVNSRRLAEREFDREKTYAAFADWIETVRGGG
jgi:hypothetical protein